MLKVDFVYKQGKKHRPQVYVEECKDIDAESQQCNMLSDSYDDDDDDDDDDGNFRCTEDKFFVT